MVVVHARINGELAISEDMNGVAVEWKTNGRDSLDHNKADQWAPKLALVIGAMSERKGHREARSSDSRVVAVGEVDDSPRAARAGVRAS